MYHELRHFANLREAGTRSENKGPIDLGTVIPDEKVRDYPDEISNTDSR